MSGLGKMFSHTSGLLTGSFCARIMILALLPALTAARGTQDFDLKIGIISDTNGHDALLGARMSLTEAQRAAQLLGGSVRASELAITNATTADDVAQWLHEHEINAVVMASDSATTNRILPALVARAIPIINVLPHAPHANLLQVLQGCEVWKTNLEPFGAAQLNARYNVADHAPMTSAAWAGWFGVKALWESASRLHSAQPDTLLAFLVSARARFDGHRGQPLGFDTQTHLLNVPCL